MLTQWIDEGRVASSALLWRDGWPQWRSAAEALPEFQSHLAAAEPSGTRTRPSDTNGSPTPPMGKTDSVAGPAVASSAVIGGVTHPSSFEPNPPSDPSDRNSAAPRVGEVRRDRKRRTYTVISVLSGLLVAAVAVLIFVINRT